MANSIQRNSKYPLKENETRNKLVFALHSTKQFTLNEIAANEEVIRLSDGQQLTRERISQIISKQKKKLAQSGGDSK